MPSTTESIVHAEPPDGSGLTRCCGRTPFELPRTDRMTDGITSVTCSAVGPWLVDHEVHVFAQTESRRGALTDEGERWMDRQSTGKVMVVCTCGYNSGLIDHAELQDTVASLADKHTDPRERLMRSDALADMRRSEK